MTDNPHADAVRDLTARRTGYQRPPVDPRAHDRLSDTQRRRRWAAVVELVRRMPFDAGVTALGREVQLHDGFPPRGDNAGGVSGRSPMSPVEAAAGSALPLYADSERIDRALIAIESEIRRLQTVVERWAPIAYPKLLCTISSYNEPWAEPRPGESFPCNEVVEYRDSGNPRPEHLCAKHRKRKERWERDQQRGAS